jgi:hypothetical protein
MTELLEPGATTERGCGKTCCDRKNATTGAEAGLILEPLRGAQAPLFHIAAQHFRVFPQPLKAVPFPVNFKIKIKVKGSGQECPLHTIKADHWG